ncbi:site-specific integrase [Phyllobacterium sp. 0TCS1.6C]|uniref:tyrosine-type recombinase/integrase n=1 Tax=unclassified Phyllobacterium TaxID=2638441 RepID=UPI002264B619|nr:MULTISPECIES: site-specific integrase [unclassified Phyllobacterium]MCX8281765.1 site-specific integrase [Phyllobacterium sp. 0TCS1.6C]MCX8295300.1 site-specific integrase [Phyllobacterium sp. 0TCS1.6A]
MPRRRTGPRLVTRKGKPFYFIRFIDDDGKQKDRSTGAADSREAEEVLEEFLKERRGVGRPQEHRRVLIAEVLADYADFKADERAAATRLGYAMTHLLAFWGEKTVDHINRETLKRYLRSANRSQSTVRRELSCLRAALNHAVAMNRMVPFGKIELPRESQPKRRWLTRQEAARLLRAARQEYRSRFPLTLFILMALYTGARTSALMELEWSQIDFERRTIDFNKSAAQETNKRRAHIPIGRKLYGHLLRRYRMSAGKSHFVFHQKTQPNTHIGSVVKGFRAACKRADLKEVTPHTLRHTCASWLAQRGEKMIDASAYLNMSVPTLGRVYAHHHPQHIKDLADRF